MHIPDGLLAPEVWVPLAGASVVAVGVSAQRAKKRLEDESIPLVGLMGAFVFALQMINFPVAAGVSDHIVGAGLLAIVFGPSIAVLCMAAILVIQALVFGDGGITALGANVFNMAILSVLTAYTLHSGLSRFFWRFAPSSWALLYVSTAVATLAGVLVGAGGAAACVMLSHPYGSKFFWVMMLTHLVSGGVEAVVTAAVIDTLRVAKVLRRTDLERTNA